MEIHRLTRDELCTLRGPLLPLDDRVPAFVPTFGNVDILRQRLVALFSSSKAPDSQGAPMDSLARSLRDRGEVVIGGFHSPAEKRCLALLLEGKQPVVICPGRSLETMRRVPPAWKTPLSEGRLLLVSHCDAGVARVTIETAMRRNRLVAALGDDVIVGYASPGGKTERFCREVVTWGKPLFALDITENQVLLSLGLKRIRLDHVIADLTLGRLRR